MTIRPALAPPGGRTVAIVVPQVVEQFDPSANHLSRRHYLRGSEGMSPSAVRQIQAPISGRDAINLSSDSS